MRLIRYAAGALLVSALAACVGTTVPTVSPTPTTPAVSTAPTVSAVATGRVTREVDRTLIAAASAGDLTGVRSALAAGADVRAVDGEWATALVRAAYGNHLTVAEALLEAGADPNHKDRSQESAYLIATSEVGDDPRLLELTLAHGADVGSLDSYRGTGLIRAADRGFPRIVERLIAAGVDLDHVNRLGWTALLEAVILGPGDSAHQEVVRLLLAAGADRGIADHDGVSALVHARRKGQTAIIAMLSADTRPTST